MVRGPELIRFLDRVPAHVLVVLDETYREFVRDDRVADGIGLYRDRPNVCVLRTFSKAYGLAGLRVGYAVAHEEVASTVRERSLPFGVTQFAQDAAVASLDRQAEMAERVALIVSERDRVRAALGEQGWEVPESQANFVWLGTAQHTHRFAAASAREGILLRVFPDEGVRVSIGTPAANDAFLHLAAGFRKAL